MTIGERIKSLRESKRITQTELAEKLGTTKQNIYKYENGIITNIPSDKIELMAKCFEVSPGYIMGWEDENELDDLSILMEQYFDGVADLLQRYKHLKQYIDQGTYKERSFDQDSNSTDSLDYNPNSS